MGILFPRAPLVLMVNDVLLRQATSSRQFVPDNDQLKQANVHDQYLRNLALSFTNWANIVSVLQLTLGCRD